jgi:hypothetical protein
MMKKVKLGKIAIVIFLTVLIWVWTDLDLDEELPVPRATISAAYNNELLVSFSGQRDVIISNIRLKGPAKRVSDVSRQINDGTQDLDFTLNPEREGMTTTGSLTLKVLDFLNRSDKIRELGGLTIESCEPEIIDVNIVKLVKKQLEIECRDENGILLNIESIVPEKVEMFVPEDSRLKAQVEMTSSKISQARRSGVEVVPYIVLAGQRRNAPPVTVKMPPEADSLTRYAIKSASLGYAFGRNLLGRYYVDVPVSNYNELVSFFIFATPEAKEAYENEDFQITLIIRDGDEKRGPDFVHRREVVYNFPDEYVEKKQIRLDGTPGEAQFKLIPLKLAENPAPGTN